MKSSAARAGGLVVVVAVGALVGWWWRSSAAPPLTPNALRDRPESGPRDSLAPPVVPITDAARTEEANGVGAVPTAIGAPENTTLRPDRSLVIRGSVVAADGGAPLEGATVTARDLTGGGLGDADADESGRYEIVIDGGVPAVVLLLAECDEFGPALESLAVAPDAVEASAHFGLDRGFSLRLLVHDEAGRPIDRAAVVLGASTRWFADDWQDGETGPDGAFELDDVVDLPRHGLRLTVRADGFAPRRFAPLEVAAGSRFLQLDCELRSERALAGVVVDAATGAPLPTAQVELAALGEELDGEFGGEAGGAAAGEGDREFESDGADAACDREGRFSVESGGLPEELSALLVVAPGFRTARVDRPWSRLAAGESALRIGLTPVAVWSGRVVDAATGTAIDRADVMVRAALLAASVAELFEDSGQTGADGRFELRLESAPSGAPLELFIEAPGYSAWLRAIDAGAALDPDFTAKLDPAVIVDGRVLRAADDSPFCGAIVRAVDDRPRLDRAGMVSRAAATIATAKSGADGSFRLELPVTARNNGDIALVVEYARRRHPLGRLALPLAGADGAATPLKLRIDVPPPRKR
ncbi:MAG: carboxypeptidase regulatory-like domain-containing protein [Planctomycetes bacterium]|nr:carboxypeptidase regulatory-like domain-containing protein [Planctomycetota bacterium]